MEFVGTFYRSRFNSYENKIETEANLKEFENNSIKIIVQHCFLDV